MTVQHDARESGRYGIVIFTEAPEPIYGDDGYETNFCGWYTTDDGQQDWPADEIDAVQERVQGEVKPAYAVVREVSS